MTKVKELFDSLSDEQKKTYHSGFWGVEEAVQRETALKIYQWFSQYFPPDELEDNLKQFVELLKSDYVGQYITDRPVQC